MTDQTLKAYEIARELYAQYGVDTEEAIAKTLQKPISLHCWQGDDVGGFENPGAALTGGIQATGNYPGKARTPDELRLDIAAVLKCLPGETKLSLHASYLDTDTKVDRDAIEPAHFSRWIDWANGLGIGLDFNQTFFSHPLSGEFSLSNRDKGVRDFWVEHAKRCRKIGEAFGKATGKTCVTNLWIHDGSKEVPVDRFSPRQRLIESLDEIFSFETDPKYNKDSIESKLFGIGSEAYVVGSHEFYLGYAMSRNKLYTLDSGHFHPTEVISAKFSSVLMYLPEIMLHVSRPVRWDSDHVVTMDDELMAIMQEIVRGGVVDRVHIGLDYFDASINRIAAWVIGARNARKALLRAYLEPVELLKQLEVSGDNTSVLALQEELKALPWGSVWDYLCQMQNVPVGRSWLDEVKAYEAEVTSKRV
jgi:L-rhamnose isomerase